MSNTIVWSERGDPADFRPEPPRCSDFDEDCDLVPDKVHCYLYDPVRGYCPYLRKP